jgi:hypothetical protein
MLQDVMGRMPKTETLEIDRTAAAAGVIRRDCAHPGDT